MPGERFHPFKGRVSKHFRDSVRCHPTMRLGDFLGRHDRRCKVDADVKNGLQLAPDDAYLSCEWPLLVIWGNSMLTIG
jgi:hypothetical protein